MKKEITFDYLIGKSIIKVEECNIKKYIPKSWDNAKCYALFLNNDEILLVEENEGCGGCRNGWSSIELNELSNLNNSIMKIDYKFRDRTKADWGEIEDGKLFIYYHNEKFDAIDFDEGYGNGYYGGGFHLRLLKKVTAEEYKEV